MRLIKLLPTKNKAQQMKKHIILPDSLDERAIQAARIVTDKGIASVSLIGSENDIRTKAKEIGVNMDKDLKEIELGKAKMLLEGKDVCILAIGNTVYPSLSAAKLLKEMNISAGVVNMRFLKPLDEVMLTTVLEKYKKFVVIEENAVLGGLSSAVSEFFTGKDAKLLKIALPDQFIEHGSQKILRDKYGLSAEKIAQSVSNWLKI